MNVPSTESRAQAVRCALYMRLSKEDDKGTESASIETQRKILRRFAREHHFSIYDEYVDDGFSGTSLDRPAFRRMQQDIERGGINVVLTKDLSRLGRNSGRVNLLIDEYFPRYRVRYISVSEGIDTSVRSMTNSLVAPVQNFANELYAADISGKIHAAFDIKMQDGDYIGAFAPYGYRKAPNNKNRLLPDEDTAAVVKRIFACAREGFSPAQIAKTLNAEQILTPSQCRYAKNPHLSKNAFRCSDEWKGPTVSRMLRNEVYLGHTLQGKTVKPSFKSQFVCAKPRREWIVVRNTHEPLVDAETWDIVRKKMQSRAQKREKGFVNLFSGLAKCADCGKNMSTSGTQKKGASVNLNCGGYKLNGRSGCTSHSISYDTLYQTILDLLRAHIHLTETEQEQLLQDMLNETAEHTDIQHKELDGRIADLNRKLTKLFDDKYSGIIDTEQFECLKRRYQKEKADCQARQKKLAELQRHRIDDAEAARRFSQCQKLVASYVHLQELDSDLLFTLIDRIEIHRGEYINGIKHQKIDVYFKFQCEAKTVSLSHICAK